MTEEEQRAERELRAERAISRIGHYWILIDRELVPVGIEEFGPWFENSPRRIVGQIDVVGPDHKTYWVSTVFLGIDHSFASVGPPLLFETMIFERHEERILGYYDGNPYTSDRKEVWMQRWATLEDAEAGHGEAIARVLEGDLDD